MPELPEVETSRRGIEPHLLQQTVSKVIIRQKKLRWPVPSTIKTQLTGHKIEKVDRRGKYILLRSNAGTLIIHLGMSGSLRILDQGIAPEKHDHFDLLLDNGKLLRLRDPRRFGAVLWTRKDPLLHKLISSLGPEPLTDAFTADYLFSIGKNRKSPIKSFIMDSHMVVGVGNIYASESLFKAGIHPRRASNRISLKRYVLLVDAIKDVLQEAINQGGTTLRDFTQQDGKPGYFKQSLSVYGRDGEACIKCGTTIKSFTLGQRSTYYCPLCQR